MPRIITVYGSSAPRAGADAYDQAHRLGRLLAEAGFALCNGGYGGTMKAAAKGAREAGGTTIGITNALFDPRPANRYISDERKAPDFFERLRTLTTIADAFICLPGSVGTLTEFALTWTLLQTRAVPPKPFLCLGSAWGAVLETYRDHLPVRPKDFALITLVSSVDEAVAILQDHFTDPPARPGS